MRPRFRCVVGKWRADAGHRSASSRIRSSPSMVSSASDDSRHSAANMISCRATLHPRRPSEASCTGKSLTSSMRSPSSGVTAARRSPRRPSPEPAFSGCGRCGRRADQHRRPHVGADRVEVPDQAGTGLFRARARASRERIHPVPGSARQEPDVRTLVPAQDHLLAHEGNRVGARHGRSAELLWNCMVIEAQSHCRAGAAGIPLGELHQSPPLAHDHRGHRRDIDRSLRVDLDQRPDTERRHGSAPQLASVRRSSRCPSLAAGPRTEPERSRC